MSSRRESPYAQFNSYNKIEQQQKPEPVREKFQPPSQHPNQQQPSHQHPNQQQQQPHPNNHQQPSHQQPSHPQSRFKLVESSAHLHEVLTNGVNNFRASFQAKNTQPPPFKIFLKLYTDWCGPCKNIAPILDEISMYEQHRDVIFLMFNADLMIKGQDAHSKALVSMLKIGAVPAFFAIVDGRIIGNVMGANVDEINGLLNSLQGHRK
jgi:thiol-disulfide isomerase/thioredoxin